MDEEQDEREGSILFVADGFYHKTTGYVLMTYRSGYGLHELLYT